MPKLCESHRSRFLHNHERPARALFDVAAAGRSTRNGAGKAAGWQALISASRRLIGIWERTGRLAGLPTHPVQRGDGSVDFRVGARVFLAPGHPGPEIEWSVDHDVGALVCTREP